MRIILPLFFFSLLINCSAQDYYGNAPSQDSTLVIILLDDGTTYTGVISSRTSGETRIKDFREGKLLIKNDMIVKTTIVKPGANLKIKTKGRTLKGKLESLTSKSILITLKGGVFREIPFEEIEELKVQNGKSFNTGDFISTPLESHYLLTRNAIQVAKGSSLYKNSDLLLNSVDVGFHPNLSAGGGALFYWPYLSAKATLSLGKYSHIGFDARFTYFSLLYNNYMKKFGFLGLYHFMYTYGNNLSNVNAGAIFPMIGTLKVRFPMYNIGAQIALTKHIFLVTDNIAIPLALFDGDFVRGEPLDMDYLFSGGLRFTSRNWGIDASVIIPPKALVFRGLRMPDALPFISYTVRF